MSKSGLSAHHDLFLAPSEQKDGSRGIIIIVIGRFSDDQPATPKPSPADHSKRLGYPGQDAGDNRQHFPPFPPYVNYPREPAGG